MYKENGTYISENGTPPITTMRQSHTIFNLRSLARFFDDTYTCRSTSWINRSTVQLDPNTFNRPKSRFFFFDILPAMSRVRTWYHSLLTGLISAPLSLVIYDSISVRKTKMILNFDKTCVKQKNPKRKEYSSKRYNYLRVLDEWIGVALEFLCCGITTAFLQELCI